ncbi:MAG: tetratricopeptide repeat protein [Acidobacteria bacterium]|nr:tetratricopeptide repeat protein [Acidobacteriota bacterium]
MARNWNVGDRLENRWEIHKIFRGGMGVVYIVHDHEWNEALAAKTFQDEVFARSPSIAPMFTREALAWVQLGMHPNIAQASFVQEIEGKPVLFLEYVSGGDLSEWIGTPRLMEDPKRLLRFAISFCDGMIHARSKGIEVHRDIKPQNCLVTSDGTLKITDFGLAKVVDSVPDDGPTDGVIAHPESVSLSRTGGAAGTVTHMPPEQFEDSKHVGVTADIYSFGVMLFQMLTGRLPFRGRTWADFERAHKSEPPPTWEIGHPQMQGLISRCLEKSPGGRYQDFSHLRPLLAAIYESMTGERAPVPVSGPAMDAAQWLNKGVSLNALGLDDAALACYDRALATDSSLYQVWSNKANIIRDSGRVAESLPLYEKALAANPEFDLGWYNMGATLETLGRPADALGALEKALSINPRLTMAWASRGVALEKLGRVEDALASFEQATRVDPRLAAAYANRANLLKNLGRLDEALAGAEKAVAIQSNLPVLWTNKGNILFDLNRYEEAITDYTEALKFDRGYSPAWTGRGNALSGLRRFEDALECYEQATRLSPKDPLVWYNKGIANEKLGRAEAALEAFDQVVELNSRDVDGWMHKGAAHSALNDEAQAYAAYTAAIFADPNNALAWHNHAIQAKALGNTEEALKSHTKSLELDPTLEEGWQGKANALADLGRLEESLAAYDEVLKLNPNHVSAWFSKGATLGNDERYAEALVCFQRAALLGHPKAAGAMGVCRAELAAADPNNAERGAAHDRGIDLVGEGKFEEAIASFDRAIAFPPAPSMSYFGRGVALGKLGRHAEALASYERATEIDPANALAWLNRGVTLFSTFSRFDEALDCLAKSATLGNEVAPKAIEICKRKKAEAAPAATLADALKLQAQEKFDDALACCEQALQSQPNDHHLWTAKSEILCDLRRFDEALQCCEKAMDLNPGHAPAWFAKGRVWAERDSHEAAIIWFKGGLDYAPNDAVGWLRIARSHEKASQLDEALDAYEHAVKADPNNDTARFEYDRLRGEMGKPDAKQLTDEGLALFKQGKTAEALDRFEQAVAADPSDAMATLGKGLALGRLERLEEALACYERVIVLDPEVEMARKCRDELVELLRVRAAIGPAWHDRGATLFKEGKKQEALECFDKALAEDPKSLDSLQARAMTLSQLGRNEDALEGVDRALAIDAEFAPALCLKGIVLTMVNQRLDEALRLLERSQQLGYPLATDGIALCRQALAKQAPKEEPVTAETWFGRAIAFTNQGRHEDAVAAYGEVIKLSPDLAGAWFNKGRALFESLNRPAEALPCFEQAQRLGHAQASQYIAACRQKLAPQPDAAEWFRRGSDIARQGGRPGEALQYFEYALSLDANMIDAWWGRAVVLGQLGRAQDALLSFDQALARSPNHTGLWQGKAAALANGGRYQEALGCYDRAVQLGDASAQQGVAYCRRALGWPQ